MPPLEIQISLLLNLDSGTYFGGGGGGVLLGQLILIVENGRYGTYSLLPQMMSFCYHV